MDGDYLVVGHWLGIAAAVVGFFASWIFCASEYGYLLGFGLGWLPSSILAFLLYWATRFLWGLVAVLVLVAIVVALRHG